MGLGMKRSNGAMYGSEAMDARSCEGVGVERTVSVALMLNSWSRRHFGFGIAILKLARRLPISIALWGSSTE